MGAIGTGLMGWGYRHVAKPVIFHMEPDEAHARMISFCRAASRVSPLMGLLHLMLTSSADRRLERIIMGVRFPNPFGLSAGLDKNGDLVRVLDAAGFGFGSFGSMTADPNPGNPRPWYHRLPEYDSLLIHAGLPNDGAEAVLARATAAPRPHGMVTFGSIGLTNRSYAGVDDMIADYARSFRLALDSTVDVVEVNISCPNLATGEPFTTPERVHELFIELDRIRRSRAAWISKPVMVKMPNTLEDDAGLDGLLGVLAGTMADGVSLSNLRRDRTGYRIDPSWAGNLSGVPCREASEHAIAFTRAHYGSRFVVNGIGGTFTADDARRKLDLGADLVAAITVFMYRGPQMIEVFKRAIR